MLRASFEDSSWLNSASLDQFEFVVSERCITALIWIIGRSLEGFSLVCSVRRESIFNLQTEEDLIFKGNQEGNFDQERLAAD